MSHYRRANDPGACYFFTVVTYHRRPFLTDDLARGCLRHAWRVVRARRPFELVALCLLPDHLHCLWRLPPNDAAFSVRWASIKAIFTREYLSKGGADVIRGRSYVRRQEACLWQRRFWEHRIRDEVDLSRHLNYIHFNPMKYGLAAAPEDWPWSTYHRYLREGHYGRHALVDGGSDWESIGGGE